uniref:Beta-porphyranase A C-terminal domain-containing protein n=1 Tax=Rhodosorus marinus TaxID=101924 RepID=A0A7S3A8X3_9RHOD|mmetsp:Transcript_7696/g.34198  ORF Transcript_7696/g.34198 Transcript_7696/m.34198 type:complete len:978 (+) Transcript_7696:345-3278(+)
MSWLGSWCALAILAVVLITASDGASVKLDFGSTLYTNGKRDFDRERLVNAHGDFQAPANARALMEYIVEELGVFFGRSNKGPLSQKIFPSRTGQMRSEGQKNIDKVDCDWCDPLRKRMITRERVVVDIAEKLNLVQGSNAKINAGANFAANFFKHFFDRSRGYPKPRYAECFNEPLVKWKSLRKSKTESEESVVRRIGNICGRMCTAITRANPEVMAGGPAASSARPHLSNFANFRKRMKTFLDSARKSGCINFISEHLYNSGGAVQDANLDLIETYTYRTSGRKRILPYMVSEAGAYDATWYSDDGRIYSAPPLGGRDFKILSDAFGGFMSSLRTHDNLLKYINFLTLDPISRQASGKYRYPWALVEGYGEKAKIKWTPLIHYFELLKGVQGDFVYSYSDDANVKVHAVGNALKAYVLLQNFATSGSVDVNLMFPRGRPEVERVVHRRLYLRPRKLTGADKSQNLLRGGYLRWSNATLNGIPNKVELKAGAMTVLELRLSKMLVERGSVRRTRHYMDSVANKGKKINSYPFEIEGGERYNVFFENIPRGRDGMAYIRIAHSRRPTSAAKPKVWVNDKLATNFSSRMAGPKRDYGDKYFGVFVVPVDLENLTRVKRPRISLQYPDDGGWISTVTLEVDRCDSRSCCVLGGREKFFRCVGTTSNTLPRRRRFPYGEQLLKNPPFQPVANNPWKRFGQTSYTKSSNLLYGNYALKMNSRSSGAYQDVYLRENSVYRLHCVMKGRMNMVIRTGDTFYGANFGQSSAVPNSQWREMRLDFRIEQRGLYEVRLGRNSSGTSSAQNGDVMVHLCTLHRSDLIPPGIGPKKVNAPRKGPRWNPPAIVERRQLFVNPSFEEQRSERTFGWTIQRGYRFRADNVLHGYRSLELYSGSRARQKVGLAKGVTYRFRCYLAESCRLSMSVVRLGTRVSKSEGARVETIDRGKWGYRQVTFKSIGTQHNFTVEATGTKSCIVDYCSVWRG